MGWPDRVAAAPFPANGQGGVLRGALPQGKGSYPVPQGQNELMQSQADRVLDEP